MLQGDEKEQRKKALDDDKNYHHVLTGLCHSANPTNVRGPILFILTL